MRISNLDTLSNCFDRLISENIKLWFFESRNERAPVLEQQRDLIAGIRAKLSELLGEVLAGRYEHQSEQRTFSAGLVDDLLQHVEELTRHDLAIGEAEHGVIRLIEQELRIRRANEARARTKNLIDKTAATMGPLRESPSVSTTSMTRTPPAE